MAEPVIEERRVQADDRDEPAGRQCRGGAGDDLAVRPDEVQLLGERPAFDQRRDVRIGIDLLEWQQAQSARRYQLPKPRGRDDAHAAVGVEEQGPGAVHHPRIRFRAAGPSATLRA